MRKLCIAAAIACTLLSLTLPRSMGQVFDTGPAGLTRQMPQIYGPHMARMSQLKYQQRHNHKMTRMHRTKRQQARRHHKAVAVRRSGR